MGRIGLNAFTEHILQSSTFPPSFDATDIDPRVLRLLPYLKRPPQVHDIPWPYDPLQYKEGWNKMNTKTSASPFGAAFSQMQAMTQDTRFLHVPASLT